MNKKLEKYLKKELGEAYMTPEEISESFHLLDIGVYDEDGKLIGFKEGEDEEGDWVEVNQEELWWTLSEAEEDYR